jgi:hypothetical protein
VSRIGSWLVISFRLHRWEVLASAVGTTLLTAAMLWFAWQLRTLAGTEPGCPDPQAYSPGCELFASQFYDLSIWATGLIYLSWGAPFGMGLVLGVPLVSREVEHRTAGMAWTLSRSRAWWLAWRVAFLALVLVGLLLVVAIVSQVLATALLPNLRLDRDFTWYGRRDGLIVVRGLVALGIGVLLGALVGRVLPALLLAALASVLVFTAISLGLDRWMEADAIVQPYGRDRAGGRSLGQRIELPSGELVTYGDFPYRGDTWDVEGEIYGAEADIGHADRVIGRDRELLVPGRLYPRIVLRESAVVGGTAVLLALAATAVVGRRRPG